MLVLTRKLNETIVIGDEVTVKLAAIGNNRVKLMIEAPKGLKILRGEIAGHDSETEHEAA